MGVTDVHSVPVPTETQDICGCGWVWQLHVTPPMRDHHCFTTIFDGLKGGNIWEGLL